MYDLSAYCVASRDFFEPLSRRQRNPAYETLLRTLVPDDWTLKANEIWLYAVGPETTYPDQGFKIHLSAITRTATTVLTAAVPVCVAHRTAFKIAGDPFLLEFLSSKRYGRGGSGKFMTIYPRDHQTFLRLLDELSVATRGLEGPYILSDRRYEGSRVVFYRYGGFRRLNLLRSDGSVESAIVDPHGVRVPDRRTPYFSLPPWIEDPFGGSHTLTAPESLVLHDRFEITEALTFSNAGGIYKALDHQTGDTILLKEARPLTACWESRDQPIDAVASLHREWVVLQRLAPLGLTPAPIAIFTAWEHTFLAQTFVDGLPLSRYRATMRFILAPFVRDVRKARYFCEHFRRIAQKLLAAFSAIHSAGIIIADVSPANVLIDPDTLEMTLVDFESALIAGDADAFGPYAALWSTPGFRTAERMKRGAVTPDDDYFGLGMLLYSLMLPVQSLFELEPSTPWAFIDRISGLLPLPPVVRQVIDCLIGARPAEAAALLDAWDVEASLTTCRTTTRRPDKDVPAAAQIDRTLDGIRTFLLTSYDLDRSDRLWPTDPFGFSANALGVAYGAAGPLLCLHRLGVEPPPDTLDWITRQLAGGAECTPGLWTGLAGLAVTLLDLGHVDQACALMTRVDTAPRTDDDPTLIQGMAGIGYANLTFFCATGDRVYLHHALQAAEWLIETSLDDARGLSWSVPGNEPLQLGAAFGASGIALFLLELSLVADDPRIEAVARRALAYDVSFGLTHGRRKMNWAATPEGNVVKPYWLHGNTGIGSTLIRFYRHLGDPMYLELAHKAAAGAFSRFSVQPAQFEGTSGIGEFLLDMWAITGERRYHQQASELATSILCYVIERPNGGLAFPGRLLMRMSADVAYGTAGVGLFLARLRSGTARPLYDMVDRRAATVRHASPSAAVPVG